MELSQRVECGMNFEVQPCLKLVPTVCILSHTEGGRGRREREREREGEGEGEGVRERERERERREREEGWERQPHTEVRQSQQTVP